MIQIHLPNIIVLNFATLLYESKTLQNTMIKHQSNIKMPRTDIDFILSPNKVKSFVKFQKKACKLAINLSFSFDFQVNLLFGDVYKL